MLIVVALAASALGQNSVTLAWSPDTGTNIAGYKLYYGVASRTYTYTNNVGNVTNATVSSLTSGTVYYFAVTAYDTSGLESAYSAEVAYTNPAATAPTIALSSPVSGASFTAPATISLAASVNANGHTISEVQFYSGAILLGTDATTPYSYTWTNVTAGSYSLTAQAVYDAGSTVASSVANMTVSAKRPRLRISRGSSATGNLTGSVVPAPTPITLSETGGQPGQTYNILASPDLKTWTIIGTMTLDATGSGQFTDPEGASGPSRLYRLASIAVTAPTLQIQAVAGAVTLSGTGQSGQMYNVLSSQDFATWTLIGTVTVDAGGSFQFADPAGTSRPRCFYRLQGQ